MNGLRVRADRHRGAVVALALLAATALSPHSAQAQDGAGCPIVNEVAPTIDAKGPYKKGAVIRDDDNVRYNKLSMLELTRFRKSISQISDQVVQGDGSAKSCFESNLAKWVATDPITVAPSQQAAFEQTWALATVALAIVKAEAGGAKITPETTRWLRRVTDQVRDFHDRKNSRNNHRAWAALAVGAAAYALRDDDAWRWALASEAMIIDQIQPDGTLPLELQRGPRSSTYHFFTAMALMPLNMLRACRGGVDARTRDGTARLLTLLHKIDQDPQVLAGQAGQEQGVITDLPIIASLEGTRDPGRVVDRLGGNVGNLRQSLARCSAR